MQRHINTWNYANTIVVIVKKRSERRNNLVKRIIVPKILPISTLDKLIKSWTVRRTEGRNGFVEVPDYWHLLDFQFWQRHVLFRTWNWNKDSDYWIATLFYTTKFLLRPNSINAVHSLVKNCRASRKQISYVVVVIVIASQISTTFCLLWHTPDYSQFNSCSDSNWHLKIQEGSRNKSRFLNWHYYSTTTKFPYD